MGELDGRVAIVTGGGGGIGSASVRAFARAGATVVAVDRDGPAAEAVAAALGDEGSPVTALAADIGRAEDVQALVADVVAEHGRVDVLHNNAGIIRAEGDLSTFEERTWELVSRVNTLGTALLCREVLPHMLAAGRGAIVNTSSAQGRLGDVGWTSYAVAKAGVEALTRSIATQYGTRGIRCNAIAPGLITTPGALERIPDRMVDGIRRHNVLGRLGRPEEVADVAVFLASDRAAYVTGQVLQVDGGLSAAMPHLGDTREAIET